MLLIGSWRISDLINQQARKQLQVMEMQRKLYDLQSYSASIGDGAVSANDLMNCPGSLFGRMSSFMMSSDQSAKSTAQQNLQMMAMQGGFQQMPNPQMQQQYQQMAFSSLYNQARQRSADNESKVLNQQEKILTSKLSEAQNQLKMIEGELQATKDGVSKDAEKSAPKYS